MMRDRRDNNADSLRADGNKAGEIWAIALSEDGQYLAASSFDGRINVWDDLAEGAKIREFETKGSFGMSIDMVWFCMILVKVQQLIYSCSLLMEDSLLQGMRMEESTSSIMIVGGFPILSQVG